MMAILYLHASDIHQQVQSKPSSDFALLRHWLSMLVYKTWGQISHGILSSFWATGWCMQLIT